MSSPVKDKLVALLVSNYSQFARRLAGRLGSLERAHEVLHDTYVRLHRERPDLPEMRDPKSYLYRMAINVAHNKARHEALHRPANDEDLLVQIPDDAPNAHQIAEGRSDIDALRRLLDTLPERRATIFRRIWGQDASFAEVAAEFGIAERTARREMMLAVRALHEATQNNSVVELQKRLAQVFPK